MTNKHKDIDLNTLLKEIGENWTPEDDEKIKESTRSEKIRLVSIGKKRSPESIEKTRQANIGRKRTPESIAKRVATKAANRLKKQQELLDSQKG